jgi:ABC-type transport system involved in cytochrome bd biosynthesis fused ATPase/permease subunit
MYTGQIKLVVVDEPSSAMDPEGEFELFKHLREARGGKTMIFITHRFGHLTRHADAILCMKDGELVEQGTHAELVAKKGEYFNLYNIQAQAFASDVETLKPSETKKEGIEEDVNPSMEALARGTLENTTLDG